MALSREDIAAVQGLAGRLKVSPGTLGGLFEMESNMDPNIWGGAGGKYRGLIQFGPEARKEVGLPGGSMTVAQQIPFVERYFQQRGFQPGKHGARELYRTVLVGNPHQGGTDSWGTNSDKAAERMLPGGDLYERASKKLGSASASTPVAPTGTSSAPQASSPAEDALLGSFKGLLSSMTGGGSAGGVTAPRAGISPALSAALPGLGFAAMVTGAQVPADRMAGGQEFFDTMLGNLGLNGSANPAAVVGGALGGGNSPAEQFFKTMVGVIDADQAASATATAPGAVQPASSGSATPAGGGTGKALGIVDLGKQLQAAGLRVREHPAFGGVGGHSRGSLHYDNKAIDVTDWQDPGESQKSWGPRKEFLAQQIQGIMGPSGEIYGPHNDKKGHGTHIHIGLPSGGIDEGTIQRIVAARQESLRKFPLRWAG